MIRSGGRAADQLRPVRFTRGFTAHAEGSVLCEFGATRVLCTASVENGVPPFLRNSGKGWLTAEYGMLPRATHTRSPREAARGKQAGRTQEIQRLIGRSLRACIDLSAIGERTITIDCDVLQADGGTRTAAITGGFVALADAVDALIERKMLGANPLHGQVAAVSVGIVKGSPVLDLEYSEDVDAETDMNVVMNSGGAFIEVQGTAEGPRFSPRGTRCDAEPRSDGHRASLRPAARGAAGLKPQAMRRVVLATGNPGKLREMRAILAGHELEVVAQADLGIAPPVEDGDSFVANALLKARHASATARACRRSRTIPVSKWTHWAAGPGSTPRATRERTPTSARTTTSCSQNSRAIPPDMRSARYRCAMVFLREARRPGSDRR